VEWDGCVSNKLHSVKPTLGYVSYSYLSRRDAVTLSRLRIGHSRFSHSYLLNREDQPRCTYFDCALTVVHILLQCPHYNIVRQRYFSVTDLHMYLKVSTTTLFWILYIGFYNRTYMKFEEIHLRELKFSTTVNDNDSIINIFRNTNIRAVMRCIPCLIRCIKRGNGADTAFHRTSMYMYFLYSYENRTWQKLSPSVPASTRP